MPSYDRDEYNRARGGGSYGKFVPRAEYRKDGLGGWIAVQGR